MMGSTHSDTGLSSIESVLLGKDGLDIDGTWKGCHFRLLIGEVYRQIPQAAEIVYLVAVNSDSGASTLLLDRPGIWVNLHAKTRRLYSQVQRETDAEKAVRDKRQFLNSHKASHTFLLVVDGYELFMYRKMMIDLIAYRTGWNISEVFRKIARLSQKADARAGRIHTLQFARLCDHLTLTRLIERSEKSCHFCGDPASHLRCSRCDTAIYCSETCQKLHWRNHKISCRPLEPGTMTSRDTNFVFDMFEAFEQII